MPSAGQFAELSEAMQRLPGSSRAAAQSQFLAPIEVWLQAYKEAQVRRVSTCFLLAVFHMGRVVLVQHCLKMRYYASTLVV